MKIVKLILWILFALVTLFFLFVDLFVGILFAIAILSIRFGIIQLKKQKKSQRILNDTNISGIRPSPNSNWKENYFSFNVAGITKNNDKGIDIPKLIKEYVKHEIEQSGFEYEGLTNKEIKESLEHVPEVDLDGCEEIYFEFEPSNPYDPNAIKIFHVEMGHIGYVPREYTQNVKKIIQKEFKLNWRLVGGKEKYYNPGTDQIITETNNYGIIINLYYD